MRILSNGVIEPSTFNTQQFNNNVDIKNFIMDRFYNGAVEDVEISDMYPIDLSTCKAKIRVNNPDDIVELGNNLTITNLEGETVAEDDDLISLNWIITNNITRYAGKRQYQIEFYNDNNTLVFRTRVMNFVVNESLDSEAAIIETAPSLIEEWENRLNTVLDQSNDFNTYADTKITEKIENKMYFYKESMQEITTSIENENNFPITMQNYNKDNCITQINVNGIRNTAYTINELNEVVFNTPIAVIGTKIQIFILKAIVSDSVDLNSLKGDKGEKGEGIPTGGTTGQVLSKKSNTNYDYEWTNNEATVEVIDNLNSTDTTKPLSANQGRLLNEKLNYTNEEQFIGYYNGDRLYRKRITGIFDQSYASSYWANTSISGTKTLVNFGGAIYDTADATGNSFNASSGTRMVRIPSGTLRLDLTNTSFVNKYFDCWVEYTRN